jgi:hypothetical protein
MSNKLQIKLSHLKHRFVEKYSQINTSALEEVFNVNLVAHNFIICNYILTLA